MVVGLREAARWERQCCRDQFSETSAIKHAVNGSKRNACFCRSGAWVWQNAIVCPAFVERLQRAPELPGFKRLRR